MEPLGYIPPAEVEANYYVKFRATADVPALLKLTGLHDSRCGSHLRCNWRGRHTKLGRGIMLRHNRSVREVSTVHMSWSVGLHTGRYAELVFLQMKLAAM